MLSKQDARNIAAELYKFMRKDVKSHIETIVEQEVDTYLNHEEAAAMLGMTPASLYHRKDVPYAKPGGKRIYSKAALKRYIRR